MWPSTSRLEKVAKDNSRIWTGSNSRSGRALLQREALGPVIAAATHDEKATKGGRRA